MTGWQLPDRADRAFRFRFGAGLAALLSLLCLATFAGVPARAAVFPLPSASAGTAAPAAPAAQSIETDRRAGEDARIQARIDEIFAQIPSLAEIDTRVSGGVVTLTGSVPDLAGRDRAEALAAGVEGVVTVENRVVRNASLDDGLDAIGSLSARVSGWIAMLPLIGLALAIAVVIGVVGHVIAGFGALWRRLAPNGFLADLIASAIRFAFVVLGLVVALDMIGAGALLGAVLGGAGVIGIALGFAMRDTIENYVASLMLSLRQPFRANDHVLIDDLEGRVIRLTSRATVLMTLDGNHLRIPNATVFKAVILNYTRNPQRRFDFALGVDADDDANAARRLGIDTLTALPFTLAEPPPEGRIEEVGDSNVVIRFLAWVNQQESDFFKSRTQAIPAVKTALEDAGFGLPEPIYRVRIDPRSAGIALASADEGGEETSEVEQDAAEPRGREAPRPASRPAPRPATQEDVAPAGEIERMVDAERASGAEPDLLDPRRPVE